MTVKEKIHRIVDDQPEDSSFDEILQELSFARMIERGLDDVKNERYMPSDQLREKVQEWKRK